MAKGMYIGLLDSDDIWLPEKLEAQMEVMSRSQTIGLVACGMYIINSTGRIENEWVPEEYRTRGELLRNLKIRKVSFNPSCALVRRACLDRVGGFKDELRFAEDWDMWLRIARHYEVRIIRKPLIKFRRHDGFKTYQQVKIMKSSIHRIISDNLNGEGWRTKGEAYSFTYLDLAGLCLRENREGMAAVYALRSFLSYPLRLKKGDYRFKLLIKALLPDFMYRAIKRIRDITQGKK
jgi:glycosyltransferase involved in cell wall biosynthesis